MLREDRMYIATSKENVLSFYFAWQFRQSRTAIASPALPWQCWHCLGSAGCLFNPRVGTVRAIFEANSMSDLEIYVLHTQIFLILFGHTTHLVGEEQEKVHDPLYSI